MTQVYIVSSNNEAARELRDALRARGVLVFGVPWFMQTAITPKREAARHTVTGIECADLVVAMSPCELFEVGIAIGADTDVLFVGVPSDAYMFYHDRMHCTGASGQALVDEIIRRLSERTPHDGTGGTNAG